MSASWTSCDCCLSRDDVQPVELTAAGLTSQRVSYLCAHCRSGSCPECGST